MATIVECRTCLGQLSSNEMVKVETYIIDETNVLKAIEEVASIEINDHDTLPKQICQKCFQNLESTLTFRKQIISSYIELKKRLEGHIRDPLSVNGDEASIQSITDLKYNKLDERHSLNSNERSKDKLKVKLEANGLENSLKEDKEEVYVKEYEDDELRDFEDSGSDWNDFNNENYSSDDVFEEKPAKKILSKLNKRPSLQLAKIHRKRRIVKKPLKEDKTSDDSSDSDVPLEELRKEIKELQTKEEEPKVRKKRGRRGDNPEGPRLCPICGKLFKARQNFNSHMTTVHRKKPDKPDKISCLCPDCGRVITGTRQNFVAHRRYHHSDKAQVKKRFTCDVCPRKFYREKNLIIHQRIHKGEKGYVCELCPDKSYTQIGGLILHRRKVHLKKPTCTCNYCGKQFYEKHYLETHIRQWHTGERPFSCEICGKAFSCNGTLLRHRKDSHGEKQPCPKCGKMYTEGELRKHLKRHKIREEGIKRKKYTCEYCGTEMNFTSRKRHLLKQHGIMLRGRGEHAERVPVSRADAM